MQTIYEPNGRALEYSLLALNLYDGCSHGCPYPCYVPGMPGRQRRTLAEFSANPKPREGVIGSLMKCAPKFAGTDKRVLMCFTCDPYQPIERDYRVTENAIRILRENDIPFQILTKAGRLSRRDFGLYGPNDVFAVTLTSLEREDQIRWEPGAARPAQRLAALMEAHRQGIQTWVSLEPVIDPCKSLWIIHETHEFVAHYKIGIWNHAQHDITAREWASFGRSAVNLCESYGRPYYVKNDLAKYLGTFEYSNTDTRRVVKGEKKSCTL